jgi:hypothetical protein
MFGERIKGAFVQHYMLSGYYMFIHIASKVQVNVACADSSVQTHLGSCSAALVISAWYLQGRGGSDGAFVPPSLVSAFQERWRSPTSTHLSMRLA